MPYRAKTTVVSNEPRRVLLIAGIDAIGISRLPELLCSAGFQVSLLGCGKLAALRSRFVAEHISSESGPDATALAARRHVMSNQGRYERIIIADEPTLWAALGLGDTNWLQGWFPTPLDSTSIERLQSKVRFLVDAREAGLNVPAFESCRNAEEARCAAQVLSYPLFIKATRGLSGSGLRFARSEAEFESQLPAFTFEEPLMIQSSIEGEAGSSAVLYDHGKPVAWFSYLMKQTWPNRFSAASAIEIFHHADAETLVHGVGEMTGFHGLAGIDWMWDSKTNRCLLLEFNPRPTPVYYLGSRAGVDFAAALSGMASDAVGTSDAARPGRTELMFPQNLYYSVDRHLPWQFLRTLADAPWSDTALVLSHIRRLLTHYIPAGIKDRLKRVRQSRFEVARATPRKPTPNGGF